MKTFLKNLIIGILIFFIVIAIGIGIFIYQVKSKSFWEKNLPGWVNAKSDHITIKNLEFGQFDLQWRGRLDIDEVKIQCDVDGVAYDVKLNEVLADLRDFQDQTYMQLYLALSGVQLKSLSYEIKDMNFNLHYQPHTPEESIYGTMEAKHLKAFGYVFDQLSVDVLGDSKSLQFKDLKSNFYDGQFTGEIVLENDPNLAYIIKAHLEDVDIKRLESANEKLFSMFRGRLHGEMSLSGQERDITTLKASLSIPKEGQIRAVLFKTLLSYIEPIPGLFLDELDILVKQDAYSNVKDLNFSIQELTETGLLSSLAFKAEVPNLNFNATIPINWSEFRTTNILKQILVSREKGK